MRTHRIIILALAVSTLLVSPFFVGKLKDYCRNQKWQFCTKTVADTKAIDRVELHNHPPKSVVTHPPRLNPAPSVDLGILSNPAKTDEEKLDFLDKLSFELASTVAKDPGQRSQMKTTATEAITTLRTIEKKLRQHNPKMREEFSSQLSESLLDLQYTLSPNSGVSLRLDRQVLGQLKKEHQ